MVLYQIMLYTRRGDKGDTSLFGSGKRIAKTDARIEALGAVDELNSLLGVCKTKAKKDIVRIVEEIQQNLFVAQAELACLDSARRGGAQKTITQEKVDALEKMIDTIEKKLPPLRNFVLAGGTELSALLDYARAVARRAERRAVAAHATKPLSLITRAYLNRLSSALFVLARLANTQARKQEQHPHY